MRRLNRPPSLRENDDETTGEVGRIPLALQTLPQGLGEVPRVGAARLCRPIAAIADPSESYPTPTTRPRLMLKK